MIRQSSGSCSTLACALPRDRCLQMGGCRARVKEMESTLPVTYGAPQPRADGKNPPTRARVCSQSIDAGEGACGQEEAQLRGLPEVLTLRAFVQEKGLEEGREN